MTARRMTIRMFLVKLVSYLEIGHVVKNKQQFVPYDHLEDDEMILWTTIHEQYNHLIRYRQWRKRDLMTQARVIELETRMRQAFNDLMADDVEQSDYENLKFTKLAFAAWKEAFKDLTEQYALA